MLSKLVISFFTNMSSPFVGVKTFGLFTGLLVTVNYLASITLFPAVCLVQELYFNKTCCFRSTAKRRVSDLKTGLLTVLYFCLLTLLEKYLQRRRLSGMILRYVFTPIDSNGFHNFMNYYFNSIQLPTKVPSNYKKKTASPVFSVTSSPMA